MKVALKSIMKNVDNDDFINQIQRHETIWNPNHERYRDTHFRRIAWDHIVRHFFPKFATKPTRWKNNVALSFQNKWRKLYDYFVKESKKIRQEGSRAYFRNSRKHFIYFNRLSFLDPVIEHGDEPHSNSPEEIIIDEDDTDNKTLTEEYLAGEYIKNTDRGKNLRSSNECHLSTSQSDLQVNRIDLTRNNSNDDTRIQTQNESQGQEDSDKMFLLSLLPDLRTIPAHSKLHVKSQILVTLLSGRKQVVPISHSSPAIASSSKKSSFVIDVPNVSTVEHCEDLLSDTDDVPGNDNDEDDILLVTSYAPKARSHSISNSSA